MKTHYGGDDHRTGSSPDHRASERREQVLAAIRDSAPPLTLADLARTLVDGGEEVSSRDDAHQDAHHVRVQLHHFDLPRLADRGAIEYDASRRVIL